MFLITYHEKILLGKLVDAYELANLSDAQPDGKDFWMSLSPEICSTVCRPLEQAMRAILKSYDDNDVNDWISGGMYMNAIDTYTDEDEDDDYVESDDPHIPCIHDDQFST